MVCDNMSFDIKVVYQPTDTASYIYLSTKLHGVTSHATAITMVTTMRTLNLTQKREVLKISI
jgi:hypothetical protein